MRRPASRRSLVEPWRVAADGVGLLMRHGGQVLADQLRLNGVRRVFCVPGESYLAALDGLYDASIDAPIDAPIDGRVDRRVNGRIDVVNARHEGGAAMMAEADGKLTGRPGIAFVTRGPGATNASAGVHVAFQDSTPMILFVGQVASDQRDREAFQEVDYRALFAPLAKAVWELERADRLPEYISRAFHVAMNGRPGPVVLALPEDRLSMMVDVADAAPAVRAVSAAPATALDDLLDRVARAERPFLIVGGPGWSVSAAEALGRIATALGVPVGTAFRCQDYLDNHHPNYAGHVGIGVDPALAARIRETDVLLVLGARLGEMTTSGYTLLSAPEPEQSLLHVHPDGAELGRVYRADLAIAADAASVTLQLDERIGRGQSDDAIAPGTPRAARVYEAHEGFETWSTPRPVEAPLSLERVMTVLETRLNEDAILTNGAGNYAAWLHRFHRFRRYRTQLAPTSGSMGYGLPAAIAASLRHPERQVVCLAGDGCFQMTMQEFGLAAERGCRLVVLVCDNGVYGTIRMHQQRQYPERPVATALVNPDFAMLAQSYGAFGETVIDSDAFADAFERALAARGPALLHLKLAGSALTPARD